MKYKNPISPFIDLIKRQTTYVGVLPTLHGSPPRTLDTVDGAWGSRWFYVQAWGSTPSALMASAQELGMGAQTVAVSDGTASFAAHVVEPSDGNVLIYTSAVTGVGAEGGVVTVPISVAAPGAGIALYVNGVPVLRRTGGLVTDMLLGTGQNTIQIVLEGSSLSNVTISVPPTLQFGLLPPPPQPPVWHEEAPIEYSFIGKQDLSGAVALRWADSVAVSTWDIERTVYVSLGKITAISYDATEQQYSITVDGEKEDVTGVALVNEAVVLGPVIDYAYDEVEETTTVLVQSDVVIDLEDLPEEDVLFLSSTAGMAATVQRGDVQEAGGYYRYFDTSVGESVPYTYRLRSHLVLHSDVVSGWSEPQTVFSQDREPPGDITLDEVTSLGGDVYVWYTAPADIDYAGVRVFLEDVDEGGVPTGTYTPIARDLGAPGETDQFDFHAAGSGTYWFRSFDRARNIQPEGEGVPFEFEEGDGTPFGTVQVYLSPERGLMFDASGNIAGKSFRWAASVGDMDVLIPDTPTDTINATEAFGVDTGLVVPDDGMGIVVVWWYSEESGTGIRGRRVVARTRTAGDTAEPSASTPLLTFGGDQMYVTVTGINTRSVENEPSLIGRWWKGAEPAPELAPTLAVYDFSLIERTSGVISLDRYGNPMMVPPSDTLTGHVTVRVAGVGLAGQVGRYAQATTWRRITKGWRVGITASISEGKLYVILLPENSQITWVQAWVRKGQAPVGASGQPLSEFLVWDRPSDELSFERTVTDGTWHIAARGISGDVAGPLTLTSVTANEGISRPEGVGQMLNVGVAVVGNVHRVSWTYIPGTNPELAHLDASVDNQAWEYISSSPADYLYRDRSFGPCTPGEEACVYRQFRFRLRHTKQDGTLIAEYQTERQDWSAGSLLNPPVEQ
jgi:hypothetical protein